MTLDAPERRRAGDENGHRLTAWLPVLTFDFGFWIWDV